ncbi:GNAT family N-acetyltransferase [Seonamhaeicola sp.]|uniref:GNAT family N-acetyltransferase n=1 Tax=Seonamhaeicola sp. TaxID=1912245 RepID=UPI002632D472|nr:GNAT family N-acetyltransferase [Seonamhaeicola sp.]
MYLFKEFKIEVAKEEHLIYASQISAMIEQAAVDKMVGLALRSAEYIAEKMKEQKAVIALCGEKLAGFCYIELWGGKSFIANSGLIVAKKYRKTGLAKEIKSYVFKYSRKNFPKAKIFGLTTNPAVMNINTSLGYKPVVYSDLTDDDKFWEGCSSCVNFDILQRTGRLRCLCTAMLFDPLEFNIEDENKLSRQACLAHQEL